MKRILGLLRSCCFSPNRTEADARIFQAVAQALQALDYEVEERMEETLEEMSELPCAIFHMGRLDSTLQRLDTLQAKGVVVVNTAQGIRNCKRGRLIQLLQTQQVPIPESKLIFTAEPWRGNRYPCWLKRGDAHAQERNDVCYLQSAKEAEERLSEFRSRKIDTAVLCVHLTGDLIKFYGVRDSSFFYWYYPTVEGTGKFGLEKYNGTPAFYPFSVDELRKWCNRASECTEVAVYGGDAVVAADGTIRLIDFNDWPSFSPCRAEAAKAIAEYIHQQLIQRETNEKNG